MKNYVKSYQKLCFSTEKLVKMTFNLQFDRNRRNYKNQGNPRLTWLIFEAFFHNKTKQTLSFTSFYWFHVIFCDFLEFIPSLLSLLHVLDGLGDLFLCVLAKKQGTACRQQHFTVWKIENFLSFRILREITWGSLKVRYSKLDFT